MRSIAAAPDNSELSMAASFVIVVLATAILLVVVSPELVTGYGCRWCHSSRRVVGALPRSGDRPARADVDGAASLRV